MSFFDFPSRFSRRQWLGVLASSIPFAALAQQRIDIMRQGGPTPIPLALIGYQGEVADTLKFDLEIAGCRIVGEGDSQYILSGSSGSGVNGRLNDRTGATLFGKAYSAGTPRQQAHALADDVIQALGGSGVAQTKIAFKCEVARGKSEIYIADYDGHGTRQVTSDGSLVAAPTWIPGKFALLYTSYRLGNPDIFFHDLPSGSRRAFSRKSG